MPKFLFKLLGNRSKPLDKMQNSTCDAFVQGIQIKNCQDAKVLEDLLDKVEDFNQRKQIRARLKEVKDIEKVQRDAMLTRIQNQRELSIQKKLKDAHEDKQRYFKMYESMSTPGNSLEKRASADLSAQKPAFEPTRAVLTARDKFKMLDQKNSGGIKYTAPRPVSAPAGSSANNFKTAKDRLLAWAQCKTKGYPEVDIVNFSSSWNDGLAFCALIHSYFPDSFDYTTLEAKNRRNNFELAFRVAEERGGVYPLLEVDDMIVMGNKPDWKCVFTYVISIYNTLKKYD